MKQVWKYQLKADDVFSVEMPKGAQVLHVNMQDGEPYMWVLVDPSRETEYRAFRLAGTGHDIDPVWSKYLGTFLVGSTGYLVFHLFEQDR